MTILYLVQKPQWRGAELFASQLAGHISHNGHRVVMVALYNGKAKLPFTGKIYSLNSAKWRRYFDVPAWRRLARIIRQEKIDIVQANAGDTLKFAALSKLVFRWKQPVVFRNASTISRYIKSSIKKLFNWFFLRGAAKIISVSESSAKDITKLYPQLRSRVITIPTGIEFTALDKKKRSIPRPALVHVGGFTYEKNHVRLISIFERIQQQVPAASLQLVGEGPLRKDIEELVRLKGLQQKVTFYGSRSDALRFINNADLLLLPSIIEGLPAVILEAFFCKTPVIAYDTGGVSELVIDNVTGRLVKCGDENGFVQAAVSALQANGENHLMAENAWQMVRAKYMNDHLAAKFMKVYQSLTGPLPRAARKEDHIPVLHVIKSLGRGGAEILLPETLRRHDKERFRFHYIYFLPWKDQVVPEIIHAGGQVMCLPAKSNLQILWQLPRLVAYIRRHRIQLIHCHLPWAGIVGRLAGRLARVPVVYTEHNKWERYHRITYLVNKLSFSQQQKVIAVSGEVAQSIKNHYNKNHPEVRVVQNGIDTMRFSPALPVDKDVRHQLHIAPESIVIGIACVFRAQKRLTAWLEVAARLYALHPALRFIIVGDGVLRNEVFEKAAALRTGTYVYFPGMQTDTRPWLKAMDIFMMTSEFEGLPVALLEAMSMGCLPACTSAGGIPEVVSDQVNGILVPVSKPMQLADRIANLLQYPGHIAAMKKAARNTVVQSFNMQKMVTELETVYEQVLKF